MLKKIIGFIFVAIGFIGFGFFRNYEGAVIPYSALWFVISIVIGVFGLYLIYISKSTKIKMTSQSFAYNANMLTNYVENSKVALFVNRFDKNDYAFEIEE